MRGYICCIGIARKGGSSWVFDSYQELIGDEKPDCVIHLAARVGGILANSQNPALFMHDDLSMGINIIEASRIHNVKKFIMLGTVCAYPKFTPTPFRETDIWNGYPEETNAPYGIAKKTLMELVRQYRIQYNFPGVNLVPTNLYGPYN